MSKVQKVHKPHMRIIFTLLTLLIYLPLFFCLAVIKAEWFGWALAALSFLLLFWLRRRKFWSGWRILLCFVCSFFVSYAGLNYARPDKDVSLMGQIGSGVIRVFVGLPIDDSVRSGEALSSVSTWTPPEGYTNEVIELSNGKLELLRKTDSTSDRLILQLHGGAFVAGLNDMYRMFAVRYSRFYQDCAVATLDYRLAPTYPYPAQQQDAMEAWRYVTDTLGYPADHVVLAGDSAGGNLVLSTTLRLRDSDEALPEALVCMSPWADLSNAGASHYDNATLDPTFGVSAEGYDGSAVGVSTTYTDGLDATDPYLSPSYGDYHGFPRMLLQAGSIEVLLSDSQRVYDNAVANGVDCTFTVYKGMFHVFQGSMDLMPESVSAWQEIADFLNQGS